MRRSQRRSTGCREERRVEGEARNLKWRALTVSEKLASLDRRLGKGVGAKKQREKYVHLNQS